jgi:hypothetical protein
MASAVPVSPLLPGQAAGQNRLVNAFFFAEEQKFSSRSRSRSRQVGLRKRCSKINSRTVVAM